MNDWFDMLLAGRLELELTSIELAQGGDGFRAQGHGRVSWEDGSSIRVQATTDGVPELLRRFGRQHVPPGQLIPLESYLTAQGLTQDGWEVSAGPVPFDVYRIHVESSVAVWDYSTRVLRRSRQFNGPESRRLRAILGPSPESWI